MTTSATTTFSPALQTWFDTHPRTWNKSQPEETYQSAEYWESALANGAVSLTDLRLAPKDMRWQSGAMWAQVNDLNLLQEETWRVLVDRHGVQKHFPLHELWLAVAERKNWTTEETAMSVATWSTQLLRKVTQEGKGRLQIQIDAWLDWLAYLAEQHPVFEVQATYLQAQDVFIQRIEGTHPALERHRRRVQRDNQVKDWWYTLPAERRQALQKFCDDKWLRVAPALQRCWLKETPSDTHRLQLYLKTCAIWWGTDEQQGLGPEENRQLLLSKLRRLVQALSLNPDKNIWAPHLAHWFQSRACEALWRADAPNTKTKGVTPLPRVKEYIRLFHETGMLTADLGAGDTLLKRLLHARMRIAAGSRLMEDVSWLEPAMGDDWINAWWEEFRNDGKNSASYMQVLLAGVDKGLPLDHNAKVKTWMRFAMAAPVAAYHKFLQQRFQLKDTADWPEAMDAWLSHWFPGQNALLTPALSLGLQDDKKQMQLHLRSALDKGAFTRTEQPAVLPQDLHIEH